MYDSVPSAKPPYLEFNDVPFVSKVKAWRFESMTSPSPLGKGGALVASLQVISESLGEGEREKEKKLGVFFWLCCVFLLRLFLSSRPCAPCPA